MRMESLFGKLLTESGIMPSMGSRGDVYDNAAMESFIVTAQLEPTTWARQVF